MQKEERVKDGGDDVAEMLSRESTLVAEIASMRAQVKLARHEAYVDSKDLDRQWLRRINYAIIMSKKELAGLRVARCAEQHRIKEERRQQDLMTRLSEQALFMRHAKRLLPKKAYEEIRSAVRAEVLVMIHPSAEDVCKDR